MNRLAGKVAIITGSASGIGQATAAIFAKEGAKVAVVDIDIDGGEKTVKGIRDAGHEASFYRADVTKSEEIKAMVGQVISKYGKIEILHNNAGGWKREMHDTVTENSDADLNNLIDLNLKSVFLVSRAVIPHLIKNGGGSIINTATINAFMGQRDTAAYSAAKAGVYQLTKAMALDYAEYKIRVNGIAPGEVETPLWIATFNALPHPAEARETLRKKIPLGRFARAEDIALTAVWLASDDSQYITGQIIVVDGGITAGYYQYI